MRLGSLCVTLLFLTAASTISAQADKRVALIVGNSAYANIPRLDNPANDARLMAETLSGLGFTLVGGRPQLDLDKSAMDQAVQSFGNELQGADVALFYYAGHGLQVRDLNFLVPVDANPTKTADADFQLLDAGLVLRQMEGSGTRLNLIILDACRNNPFGGRGLRASGGGLAQMQAPEGTLISFATQPGNVASDGEGNSPYTKALAQTLHQPGLGIFDVFNEVGLKVKRATSGSQQPWVSSSPIDGAFFFAAPSVTDLSQPQAGAQSPAAPVEPGGVIKIAFKSQSKQTCTLEDSPKPRCGKPVRTALSGESAIEIYGDHLIFRGIAWNGAARINSVDERYYATCTNSSHGATVKAPDSEELFTYNCGYSIHNDALELTETDLLENEGAIVDKTTLRFKFDLSQKTCGLSYEQTDEGGDVEKGTYDVSCETTGQALALLMTANAP